MVPEAKGKNKGFPIALFDYLIRTSSAVRGDSVIAQEDAAQASTQLRKLSQMICGFFLLKLTSKDLTSVLEVQSFLRILGH